ncbi:MAG: TIGR00269 family protein [Candidatus Woesearchaeota archaeon]
MKCSYCKEKAIISQPGRCKKHFIEGFKQLANDTIKKYELIKEEETICVAASGGKDSLALLDVLSENYAVEALCVDEGIAGYRDTSIQDLKAFCTERNIPLRIVSFADLGSKSLDELNPEHPCSVCGVLRRKALLEYSKQYDVIATGHNLDDECQSILMNLLRNQRQLLSRLGPRTTAREEIAARIKPFYFIPEREIRAYCLVQNITTNFSECPNVVKSFRWRVGEELNELERRQPGTKKTLINEFIKKHYQEETQEQPTNHCSHCGNPASGKLCRACEIIRENI